MERYCELANKTTQQLYKVSTPCIDDHHFKEEELKSVGELSKLCSQIVLKCLYLARIGRPDIRWSVNKLARSITKEPRLVTNDYPVLSLTFIIHVNTNSIVMCFKTPILQEILRIQNPHQVEHCAFSDVKRLFQSVGCVSKKKKSASHSSTESEIISLDAGLRLDEIPART